MNLKEHYKSYYDAFGRSYLEGYVEDAKKRDSLIERGGKFLPIIEFAIQSMQTFSKEEDESKNYFYFLHKHQQGMLDLFDEMVLDRLGERKKLLGKQYMSIYELFGWKWFKYCRSPLMNITFEDDHLPPIEVVPRYFSPFVNRADITTRNYFDADELSYYGALGRNLPSKETILPMLDKKPDPRLGIYKFLPGGDLKLMSLEEMMSSDTVYDWTIPSSSYEDEHEDRARI